MHPNIYLVKLSGPRSSREVCFVPSFPMVIALSLIPTAPAMLIKVETLLFSEHPCVLFLELQIEAFRVYSLKAGMVSASLVSDTPTSWGHLGDI